MSRALVFFPVMIAVALTAAGCGGSLPASNRIVDAKYHLADEPANAVEILDAKEQAKDGEAVVVVGRLGGGVNPWIDGRAAFLLVDTRILPTCQDGEKCDENCLACAEAMLSASTMVKFLDNDGKVLPVDARDLLGVKEQQTVVVRGVANRDKAGNVSIAAEKIYVRR
jgi:hypothetical protein